MHNAMHNILINITRCIYEKWNWRTAAMYEDFVPQLTRSTPFTVPKVDYNEGK